MVWSLGSLPSKYCCLVMAYLFYYHLVDAEKRKGQFTSSYSSNPRRRIDKQCWAGKSLHSNVECVSICRMALEYQLWLLCARKEKELIHSLFYLILWFSLLSFLMYFSPPLWAVCKMNFNINALFKGKCQLLVIWKKILHSDLRLKHIDSNRKPRLEIDLVSESSIINR